MTRPSKERSTAVLDVRGLQWASEQNIVAAVLCRRPGVLEVAVNPVAQTATVVFDPARTSLAELRRCVTECGYHCAGQSVPAHVCDPMAEPDPPASRAAAVAVPGPGVPLRGPEPAAHDGHAVPPVTRDLQAAGQARAPHDAMGHGGQREMSMAAMVADMRNRFVVAAVFSVAVLAWSPIGLNVPVPFGLRGGCVGAAAEPLR